MTENRFSLDVREKFPKTLSMPYLEIALIFLVVVISLVAVKIGISFDVNIFLEHRRKRQKERLKVLCPHVLISPVGENYKITPLMKPISKGMWSCSRCNLITDSEIWIDEQLNQFRANPSLILERELKFQKYVKKYLGA